MLVTQLAQQPQPVIPRQHLKAARLCWMRSGDEVLDHAELLQRTPQLRQQARANTVRVPIRFA